MDGFFADKPFDDDVDPHYWNLNDISWRLLSNERHRQAKAGRGQPLKNRRLRHSAADMYLAHEILSDLSRYGAHPSELEPITGGERSTTCGPDDWTRIYSETRKGWEPLDKINGRPSGVRELGHGDPGQAGPLPGHRPVRRGARGPGK